MTVFVGVTGASGAVYADRAISRLAEQGATVWATITPTADRVLLHELGLEPGELGFDGVSRWFGYDELTAPPASGSTCADAMLIVPCSMGTLGRIAAGTAESLITRAADVCLKERKPLVLVTRETPLNLIHLRNMTTVTEAGGIVLPACPHFYGHPETIPDLVDTVVARALTLLGLPDIEQPRWSPDAEP